MRIFARIGLVLTVVLAVLLSLSCWGGSEGVTVQNNSSRVVVVFENDNPIELVHPAVTVEFPIQEFEGTLRYEVRSFDTREVLASRSFTWQEIEQESGITFVIE